MPTAHPDIERYAAALVDLAAAAGKLDRLESEMEQALDWLEKNDRVRKFLSDPRVRTEGKRAALEDLLKTNVDRLLLDYLSLLINQDMAARLSDVAQSFLSQAAALRSEVSGELVTARELDPDRVGAIEKEVSRLTGKSVRLRPRVSSDMLGGVYVKVGSFVFDGTIDHRLDQYRKTLSMS